MVEEAPTYFAAIAVACAWLPDEYATTPRSTASRPRESTRFAAPLILKAPPRWRFSHLKKTRAPASASKPADVNTGVRRASGRIRSAAASTSSEEIARLIHTSLADLRGL